MSRDHDAPLEYLRILASLKLRFGLATLVTARGALPVVYPIEEQGHSASLWLRWTLSYPIHETDRQLLGGMSSTKRGGFCGGYTCEIAEPVGRIQVPS